MVFEMSIRHVDISGQSFGALKVLKWIGTEVKPGKTRDHQYPVFECVCNCGRIVYRKAKRLRGGSKCHCGDIECKRARLK